MRTDLTAAFLAETEKSNRHPVTLCEFHFPDGIRYLSDQVIGLEEGLAQDYEPLIEDWGNLKDNVRIEPILGAKSLEVRQMNLSVINIGDPPFSQKFKDVNPENVKVYIYQWFRNLALEDLALIDIFVCQDPIVVSEAQSLVRIQLLSPIMTQNPFIWGPNKFVEVRYPMVLGKWKTVARSMETGPTAFLLYDIDQNFTGEVFLDANSTKDKWPTPPFNVFIDSEQLTVDTMEISKMNITARGQAGTTARPHIRGALVCDPSAQYDYSLTAGPVQSIENVLGDEETYNNPFTALPGQDPAIIRFDGRPPWHKVEAGEPGEPIIPPEETTSQYGTAYETDQEVVGAPSNPTNINNAGSNAVMSFDHTIGDEQTDLYNTATTYSWDDPPPDPNGAAIIDVQNPDGALNTNNNDQCVLFHDSDVSSQLLIEPFNWLFSVSGFPDLSHLGTFVSVKFTIFVESEGTDGINNNSSNNIHARVNGTNYTKTRLWGHKSATLTAENTGINSWSALQSADVGVYFDLQSLEDGTFRTKFEVEIWYIRAEVTYLANDDPTYPKQEVVSHFNRDLSDLGAFVSAEVEVRFDCSSINCELDQDIVFRTSNNPANNSVLWGRTITSTQGMATVKVYPSIGSMATLKDARIGLRHWLVSPATPGSRRYATTNIASVLWKITYQPGAIDQPDEERVVYVNELTAEVTAQGGANQTPARAIQSLLENVGNMGEYIDTANFDEKHALYDAAQYYFNGLIDGETRLHDALKSLIHQGSTRLAWNAGKVKLVSSFVDSLEPATGDIPAIAELRAGTFDAEAQSGTTQYIFKPDHRQRSVTEKRMRFDDVTNKVTIRYNPDYKLQEWLGEFEITDDDSINSVGEQEESVDLPYVSNSDIVADIGARILELKGRPRAFDTFRVYFKGFKVEKSDQMFFETDFNAYYGVIGPVLTANRIFGSGKSGRMNIFEITIMSTPVVAHELNISETINVESSLDPQAVLSIHKIISESINIGETLTTEAILTLQLNVQEQLQIDDSLSRIVGVQKELLVQEIVNLADSWSTQEVLPIELQLEDIVNVLDSFDTERSTVYNLDIAEQINILDDEFLQGTTGYGMGGYGEGGYGGALAYQYVTHTSGTIDQVTHAGDDVIHYPS